MPSLVLSKTTQKRWKRRLMPTVHFSYGLRNSIYSALERKAIRAYWYQENNFGDRITPDLLRYYGLKPIFSPNFEACQVAAVGSILEILPDAFDGTILGSGFINSETTKQFSSAKIALVRGYLTAEKFSMPIDFPVGDPGILVDRLYQRAIITTRKKYTLGLVPHYRHASHPAVHKLVEKYPDEIALIDVRQSPKQVSCDIAACRHIASSSLHGIVVAHSLNIPVVPIKIEVVSLRGGTFKFEDYFSAYDKSPLFHTLSGTEVLRELCSLTTAMAPNLVDRVKQTVHTAFLENLRDL